MYCITFSLLKHMTSCEHLFPRGEVWEVCFETKFNPCPLSVPIIPQLRPLAPYPALCCPTPTTSPDLKTTPVCCALTRTSERNSVASLSSMTPCTRRKRASTSASACPWVARWAPTSQPPRSPSWQTATMVSGFYL